MAVVQGHSRRFSASSPVTRYWLANCVGFSLTGGGKGTVERVLAGEDPFVPSLLEVRASGRRLHCVPITSVLEVVPRERLIVVAGRRATKPTAERRRDMRRRLGRAVTAATQVAVARGIVVLRIAASLALLAREAWRAGHPIAVTAARRGGKETVRLVRSVPWQRYGRSARSATTRLWQDLSSRSSRRRTTSSETRSETSSRERARTTSST